MKKLVALVLAFVFLSVITVFADEVTLVDNSAVTIRVKKFDIDSIWGTTMKVYLENKTNKTVMFSIDACVVDGLSLDPFWAKELMPNSKANAEIQWYDLDNIPTIVECDFRVYDSNDWMADDIYKGHHVIYPQGEAAAQSFANTEIPDGLVLADTNDLTILATGTYNDDIWGYTLKLFLHNKTNRSLMFSIENSALNGFSIDPYWACEVPSNARAYSDVSWSNDSLEENDIVDVNEILLAFRVHDAEDWFASDLYNNTITLVTQP